VRLDVQRHVIRLAVDRDVGTRVVKAEVAQDHVVEEGRKMRIAQPDVPRDRVELEAEGCYSGKH
jgi:hypothetical protein